MSIDALRTMSHVCPADDDLIARYTEGHQSGQLKSGDIEHDLKNLAREQTELRQRAIGCQGMNADGTCLFAQKPEIGHTDASVSVGRSLRGLLRR